MVFSQTVLPSESTEPFFSRASPHGAFLVCHGGLKENSHKQCTRQVAYSSLCPGFFFYPDQWFHLLFSSVIKRTQVSSLDIENFHTGFSISQVCSAVLCWLVMMPCVLQEDFYNCYWNFTAFREQTVWLYLRCQLLFVMKNNCCHVDHHGGGW